MSKKNRQSIADMAKAMGGEEPQISEVQAAPIDTPEGAHETPAQDSPPASNVVTEPAPTPVQVLPEAWYEVSAGMLPKLDIKAPSADHAKWEYMKRMRITGPEPVAKKIEAQSKVA